MFTVQHDIEKAIYLRKLGWSHKDIAEFMQCSESWCRHNLSTVKKDKELMHKSAIIANLYTKQIIDKEWQNFINSKEQDYA